MKNERDGLARASSCVSARALASIAGLLCCAPALAEMDFGPQLGLDLIWVDNLNLTTESPVETYVAQVSPGLRLTQEGRRLNGYLDYEAQALFYEHDSSLNDVFHHAALSGDFTAIEDWFFIGADGSYFQSIIDPEQPINRNNIFNVSNITDTAAARIRPALRHEFNSATLDAYYSVGFVDYRDNNGSAAGQLDDSRNKDGAFELRATNEEALLTWATRYQYEHVEYDVALPFEYERADAELGLLVAGGLRLLGRGGVESDPFDLALGGLEESFWDVGILWQRGDRAEVLFRVGERFFGTSSEALVRLRGRVLWVDVGYDQLPTTETQRTAMRDVQPPDPAAPIPPEQPAFGRTSSDVYLLKRLHGVIGAVGRYTHVGVEYSSELREYIRLAGIEDEVRNGRFFVSRQFGQRTQAELSASVVDADLRTGTSYREEIYTLELTRELSLRTLVSLTGNHLRRSGDFSYNSSWISLGLLMTFL